MKKSPLSKIVQKAQPLIDLYDKRKQIVAKALITSREVDTAEQDCWWNLFVELPIALTLSWLPYGQLRVLVVSAKILKYCYS
jgi:hypothetical protein